MRRPDAQPSPSPTESPIVAWLTGAAVKQAIAKAARSLAEGKSEDVIAQVGSLVEENALLKSDNAALRNEIASLAKRLDKVRAELDAIKRAVARGLNKEDFEFSSHRSIIDEIVGKGYGHTESGERLLRMHAQEVVELILKKAGEDVLKQIELAAAVKDRLTDVNPNKDLPVALAIVESVKSWFIAYWSPRDHRRHERRSRAWRAGAVLPWRGCRTL
jgi:regulator of replication initiation timing